MRSNAAMASCKHSNSSSLSASATAMLNATPMATCQRNNTCKVNDAKAQTMHHPQYLLHILKCPQAIEWHVLLPQVDAIQRDEKLL
jgi:hypothetical protein